jgi:DegV family protein with EDD domain
MSVKIIIDSGADLPSKYEELLIKVPMTLTFGEEEYKDGITIDKNEFYKKLESCDSLPVTSQIPPLDFEGIFEQVSQAGDEAVVITLSSGLSGTWQNACIAAENFPDIYVVDSLSGSLGIGILAEYALQCANQGMAAEELSVRLKDVCNRIRIFARMDTLEYLKRGGRISKTAALAAGVLNIRPVITIENGQLVMAGKARGTKKANNILTEKVEQEGIDYTKPILLGYTGLTDAPLQEYIESSKRLWEGQTCEIEQAQMGGIIGTHTGPGTIAVAYFVR